MAGPLEKTEAMARPPREGMGEGPMVFLPGFACRSWVWEKCMPLLRGREVVLVDWPEDQTPGWRTLQDYADWLASARGPALARASAVVGHSMGGLLALMLSGRGAAPRARAVLVDAHLSPAAPFYRTTFAPSTDEAVRRRGIEMVRQALPRYDPLLGQRLKTESFLNLAEDAVGAFGAIYGGRGSGEEEASANLRWPERLRKKAILRIVPNSAHFPMLETPESFVAALEGILSALRGYDSRP